eukprot:CAMPEP_0170170364 /NCGR_PEP_ID=MMETSP0040_2-20121228/3351_1 /TAXON_ID=641309 /ORGANISM="Lotharella oceanica, Strain CCMP622" /LENGTH=211 /DNA_ID=CAMNT_0010409723 /DNA_START=30 /DNA_END=665 /DNA_ORIENTATION=-
MVRLLHVALCAAFMVSLSRGQQDLMKATVLPSSSETMEGSSQELGELARLISKQPASAEEDSADFSSEGMEDLGDGAISGVQFIKSNPKAMSILKEIKMLSKLIAKAKDISKAIPSRESKLEKMKANLKSIVEKAIADKKKKIMEKFGGTTDKIDGKIKLVEQKLEQLKGAKAKITSVASKFGEGGESVDGSIDSLLSDDDMGGDFDSSEE